MGVTHLLLMRHAKSSWNDPSLDDHDRPLNARGRRDCPIVANALHARGFAPDLIWASSAVRTRETAERMMRALPGAQTVVRVPEFYHASAGRVLDSLAQSDEPEGKLMLLGHNPGWSQLVELLGGGVHRMPTAAVAVFARKDADEPWWSASAWRLVDMMTPKEILPRD